MYTQNIGTFHCMETCPKINVFFSVKRNWSVLYIFVLFTRIHPYAIPSTRSSFLCRGDWRPGLEKTEALKHRLYFVACLIYNTLPHPEAKWRKTNCQDPQGNWNTSGNLLSSDWDIINHHGNEREAPVSSIEWQFWAFFNVNFNSICWYNRAH